MFRWSDAESRRLLRVIDHYKVTGRFPGGVDFSQSALVNCYISHSLSIIFVISFVHKITKCPYRLSKLQNVMFSFWQCCGSLRRYLRVSQVSKSKAWGKSAKKLLGNIFMNFYKAWMWQCDTCNKHFPKFLMRIIYKYAVDNKKKHWDLPGGFCQNKYSNIHIC